MSKEYLTKNISQEGKDWRRGACFQLSRIREVIRNSVPKTNYSGKKWSLLWDERTSQLIGYHALRQRGRHATLDILVAVGQYRQSASHAYREDIMLFTGPNFREDLCAEQLT